MCKSNHPSLHSIIWQWGSLLFFAGETTYQCLFCHLMWRKSWLKLSRLFQKLSTINCEFISLIIFSLYCACLEDSYWVVAQLLGTNWCQLINFQDLSKKDKEIYMSNLQPARLSVFWVFKGDFDCFLSYKHQWNTEWYQIDKNNMIISSSHVKILISSYIKI